MLPLREIFAPWVLPEDDQAAKQLLESATCEFSWWCERVVSLPGYATSLPLEEVVKKIADYAQTFRTRVAATAASNNPLDWPTIDERGVGIDLCLRYERLYEEAERDSQRWSIQQLIKKIVRIFASWCCPFSDPSHDSSFIGSPPLALAKEAFCTYGTRECSEKFPEYPELSQGVREEAFVVVEAEKILALQRALSPLIAEQVQETLNQLFEGSSYSVDRLPLYPLKLNKAKHCVPQKEYMRSSVVKGVHAPGGQPFIAIKLRRDAPIGKKVANVQLLILAQTYPTGPIHSWLPDQRGELLWVEITSPYRPYFFNDYFTWADTGACTEKQADNFKLLKHLLQTGSGKDLRGVVWHLVKETGSTFSP